MSFVLCLQGTPGPGGLYPAACDLIVNAIATEMQEEVLQRMWDFLRSYFIPEALETIILEWKDLVREAHELDPNYPAGKVSALSCPLSFAP